MDRYCLKCTEPMEIEETTCSKCGNNTAISGVYSEHNKFYCKECGSEQFVWVSSMDYNYKFVSNFKCKRFKCKNGITTIHFRF